MIEDVREAVLAPSKAIEASGTPATAALSE
jgi:hypothetical protein